MKRFLAVGLVLAALLSLAACGKSEEAKAADALIEAIGEVSLDSEAAISSAEDAVEALSEEDKKAVDNETLSAARDTYDSLLEQKKIDEDKASAAEIDSAISAIGTPSVDNADPVYDARRAYNKAPASVKEYVTKLSVLEAAETELKEQLKAVAEPLLAQMWKKEDPVRGLTFYHASAFPHGSEFWYSDVRHFVLPYIGKNDSSVWLRMICNYTADDWVFFEKITFAIDDERYYEFFSYNDVVRDNEYGDVWEYVDLEVNDERMELLEKIANSGQTIVRFEGDEYYRDFTVSQSDKQSIKDLLLVYNSMK